VHGGSLANPPKVGQGEKDSRGYRVFNGIAFDKSNKEVGFHYCVNDEWEFIHKFNSFGLHNAFYDRNALPTRAGQSRNFPLIASAIIDIEDYTTLKDYVMAGGKNAAAFGFAIESSDPASVQSGMSTVKDDGNQDFVEYVEGKANILGEVSPEFMAILPEGAKAVFPNAQGIYPFRDLLREYTMNIAAWVGLNPQILTKDISGSNFASAKFSGQSTLKTFRTWGEKLNIGDSIILKRVLFEAQISGEYNGEIEVEHQWIGDVNFDDVDSLKAANSASEKIRNNTASRTQELAKTKGSFKAIVGDAVQELKVIKQAVADNPEVTQEEIISWMTANTTEKIDIDNTTSESNDGE
jgi:capsid protein